MYQIIQAFKLSFSYIKRYPKFWLYFVLRIVTTLADVSVPLIIGYIIVLLTNHGELANIYVWAIFLTAIIILNPVLDKIAFVNSWYISVRIAHDFRLDEVKRLRHTGLVFWQRNDKGNVLKIIDQAFEHFALLSGSIIHSWVPFLGRTIGIFVSTTLIDPVIGILFLIDAVFFTINIKILLPKESETGIGERMAHESVYGRINEYLTNYKTIVYLNLFGRQNAEISGYNEGAYLAYKKRERLSGWKWYFNNQIHAVCISAIIIYSIWQVLQGHLQVGLLTTIVFFSLRVTDYMTEGAWNISELVKFSNSIRRYNDTFKEVSESYSGGPSKTINFKQLAFESVSLQQENRETLRNVDLLIKKGQKVAIVGYTGSGKTTLVDILLKAITSYDGEIFINNHNYRDLHVQDIAKIYSIVPQEVQLFQGTLKDNIAISPEYLEKNLQVVIKVAELTSLIDKLPSGVDSHIHEGASNISGGERQRIGIARSLLQNRPVLILDEATANLDPKTEREVITNIIGEYPKLTMLYITHKYSLLNLFDEIVVMNEGSIIEQGSFESLIANGGLFKDLFEASQMK